MKKAFIVVMSLLMVFLCSFSAFAVDTYQPWSDYPESPVPMNVYPYQVIVSNSKITLAISQRPFYNFNNTLRNSPDFDGTGGFNTYVYNSVTDVWDFQSGNIESKGFNSIIASSQDVYTDSTLTDVFFSGPKLPYLLTTQTQKQLEELPSVILGTFSTVFPTGLAVLGMLLGVFLVGLILRRIVFS